MAKGCALSTGYLPQGGLPRNSVDRITDRPDMTADVKHQPKQNQRTIGPVNAHLISWPSKAQSIQNLENIW